MIQSLSWLLGVASAALWCGLMVHGSRLRKRWLRLAEVSSSKAREPEPLRRVSVVIAARNEVDTIGEALPSVLALDYPDLEIIVVDDGSDDGTETVLQRFAAGDPRIRVLRVDTPPPGWLGKNYALHHGAASATGDWLLFTDADVRFHPQALRLAITYAEKHGVDHLAVAPEMTSSSALADSAVLAFALLFSLRFRPHHARNRRRRGYVGSGGFNLVRASWYRRVGGHRRIRNRPDDDVELGRLLKTAGAVQDFLDGRGMVRVQWYPGVRAMMHGLEKNVFAALRYRLDLFLLAAAVRGLVFYLPWVGAAAVGGAARLPFLAASFVMVLIYARLGHTVLQFPLTHWILFPAGQVLLDFMIIRSVALALMRKGVPWRGRFYPLRMLKEPVE